LVYYCCCFSLVFNWRSHNVFTFRSDIYPILERVCLEGSRMQAKFAVAAIAALAGVSEHFFFSELCKVYLFQYFGATSDVSLYIFVVVVFFFFFFFFFFFSV